MCSTNNIIFLRLMSNQFLCSEFNITKSCLKRNFTKILMTMSQQVNNFFPNFFLIQNISFGLTMDIFEPDLKPYLKNYFIEKNTFVFLVIQIRMNFSFFSVQYFSDVKKKRNRQKPIQILNVHFEEYFKVGKRQSWKIIFWHFNGCKLLSRKFLFKNNETSKVYHI